MSLRRYVRFKYLKLIRLKDSPGLVAKGVALGVGLDFLPLPLISLPIAYIIARFSGINSVAAVTSAALFKVMVPFFWTLDVAVGNMVFRGSTEIPRENLAQGLANPPDPLYGEHVSNVFTFFHKWGYPFLIGSAINAVIAAVLVYFIVYPLLRRYQHRRRFRRKNEKPADIPPA